DYDFNLQNNAYLTNNDVLTAGYEYERQRVTASDNIGTFLKDQEIINNGAFVQNKLQISRYIVTAGVRWDHYNSFGNTVNPRIGLAYKVTDDFKIRGSYGRAFRAPFAGELALPYYG